MFQPFAAFLMSIATHSSFPGNLAHIPRQTFHNPGSVSAVLLLHKRQGRLLHFTLAIDKQKSARVVGAMEGSFSLNY